VMILDERHAARGGDVTADYLVSGWFLPRKGHLMATG
jgi:hypothetical protein